ncbi:MAG: peptidoglycan DD-metalloendopeptidase family protein [Oscillospiraceae bacterium]|nr:peptidoglycan DD-metalloendopeptidase family protein [Oscillospiraceae bacterium]
MRHSNSRTLYAPRALVCADSFFSRLGSSRPSRRYALAYASAVACVIMAGAALIAPRAAMAANMRSASTESIGSIADARVPLAAFEADDMEKASPARVEESSTYLSVPFETVTVSSADLYKGETAVLEEGREGLRRVLTRNEFFEGAASPVETVSSELVTEPVAKKIAVGTAERPITASYGSYIWPANGAVSSRYGFRGNDVGSSNHKGLDIAGKRGDAIYAADGGEVILADRSLAGYGLLVQIQHDNGDVTYYGHNDKLLVEVGEKVQRGQKIAEMGATGVASGVHCHFEIRKDGIPVNPEKYLP